MRLLLAILILFSLCFQCSVQLGIVGWYELNQKAITEKYCINKNKPQLHCNGKCHLKKQLNKANSPQNEQPPNSQTEWAVFVLPNGTELPQPIFLESRTRTLFAPAGYLLLLADMLFRPPQAAIA